MDWIAPIAFFLAVCITFLILCNLGAFFAQAVEFWLTWKERRDMRRRRHP